MRPAAHLVSAACALAFAASFLLPWRSFNSPLERLAWTVEAIRGISNRWELWAYRCAAVAIVYPYVWALAAALGHVLGLLRRDRPAVWAQIACHAVGGAAIAYVGILLLASRDTWFPRWVQAACVAAPLLLTGTGLAALRFAPPGRQLFAVTALGFLWHAPIRILVADQTGREGLPVWGYALAGLSALAGLLTAAVGSCLRRVP